MKQNYLAPIKRLAHRLAPPLYDRLQSRYWHRRFDPIFAIIRREYGNTVADGPFRGMLCLDGATGSAYLPKILGCYEQELHAVIETIVRRDYPIVIDIGCAEGYYVMGLARRLPAARLYAFDTDSEAQRMCKEMAARNGVEDRVIVGGYCGVEELNGLDLDRALLVCDCEGYELELLKPDKIPGLTACDLLVELHEFTAAGLTAELLERFKPTHDLQLIDTAPRDLNGITTLQCLPAPMRQDAVEEGRPCPMQWAFLTAKS